MRVCCIAANVADDGEFTIAGVFFQEVFGHEFGDGLIEIDAVNEDLWGTFSLRSSMNSKEHKHRILGSRGRVRL